MILWKCCTQYASKFGKLSSGLRTGKGQFSFPIPKIGNAKEYSNYCTIALISHTSKVMLKIIQVRSQQYMNWELPDVQAGFRKGWNQRSNFQHLLDHQKSKRVSEKHLLCFIDYAKDFDCVDHNKLENSERDGNTRPPDLPPEKSVCRSRSNSRNWTWNNRLVPN